jgi:hypothetical protein
VAFLAVFIAGVCLWIGGAYLQGYQPAWCAYILIIVVMMTIFGFSVLLRYRKALPAWRKFIFVFLCTGAFLLSSLAVYSIKVIAQAKDTAAGAPYCLQISNKDPIGAGSEYRMADALLALSPLTMRADRQGGMSMNFHALLIVKTPGGPRLYNWSYNKGEFTEYPKPQYWPILYCVPQKGFLDKLPVIFPDHPQASSLMYFNLWGREFQIPAAYRPQASSSFKEIAFMAEAPDFRPMNRLPERLGWEWINHTIEVVAQENMRLFVSHVGAYTTNDYIHDKDGKLIAKIECTERTCNHVFLHNGYTYIFSYPRNLYDDRRQMQQRLIEKVDVFTKNGVGE